MLDIRAPKAWKVIGYGAMDNASSYFTTYGTTFRIRFVVNLVNKTTAVFCKFSGKGYLRQETICTKRVKYVCILFVLSRFQ